MFILFGCLFNSLFLIWFLYNELLFYLVLFYFKRGIIKVYLLYWILSFNYISIIFYSIIEFAIVVFYFYSFDIRLDFCSLYFILVIHLISYYIVQFSIKYLSIIEISLFLIYIILFQLSMNFYTLFYDFIFIFIYWDIIGLISYLLINFWSSKIYCGIKAVIYNKFGDCFFIFVLSFSFINYHTNLGFDLFLIFYSFYFIFDIFFNSIFSLSLLLIYFSKSAQFPFSSWLLYAMSAPTPISALLHSSTMVIAGLYFIIILYLLIILFILYLDLFYIMILILPIYSLLWSVFIIFYFSDIKSIIACSTINQISYMFLVILYDYLLSIFHFFIHGLFKYLLFLLSVSLINSQSNFQSIYKIKLNNYLIKILFIVGIIILIFSLSKEIIIKCLNSMYNSIFIYIISILCGILTIIYSLKIYIYCFYLSFYIIIYSSFILPMLTISSILIDQCLDLYFSFCSLSLFISLDFGELFSFLSSDSILHFSIIIIFYSSLLFSLLLYALIPMMLLQIYLFFSSELSYFTFQLAFLLFSTSAPIHSIELFTGCSSCYCLYHIHYLTSFQYILFFILAIIFLLWSILFLTFCCDFYLPISFLPVKAYTLITILKTLTIFYPSLIQHLLFGLITIE